MAREVLLHVRLTEEERRVLGLAAARLGLSVSEYARMSMKIMLAAAASITMPAPENRGDQHAQPEP